MPALARPKKLTWFNDPFRLFAVTGVLSVSVPGFASIKAGLLLLTWAWLLFQERRFKVLSVLWFLSAVCGITVACVVGLHRGVMQQWVTNQGFRTLTLFIIISCGLLLARHEEVTTRRVDRLIFWIAFLAAILKSALVAVMVFGLASAAQVQATLGFETVQDHIAFGLIRLQFPSDIILQFLLVCYVGGRRRFVDALALFSITVGVLFSFSRYIFAAYALSLVIRALLLRRIDFVSRIAGVLAGATIVAFLPQLIARFNGAGSAESDSIRTQQLSALRTMIYESPLLGIGMGSSARHYLRSETMPFSYEVQWYALAMQFGIIGVTWFVINVLAPLILIYRDNRQRLFFLVMWLTWAASGFTNPGIVSVGSGFGLAILTIRLTRSDVDTTSRKDSRQRRRLHLAPAA